MRDQEQEVGSPRVQAEKRIIPQLLTFTLLSVAAYVWFACNFEYSSFCGWTCETRTGAEWLTQTNGAAAVHRGPTHDHTGMRHDRESAVGNLFYEAVECF